LGSSVRDAIYGIYGFVRYADEIVDTFHHQDKKTLLDEFEQDYYKALNRGLSLNPILNSFVQVVQQYNIKDEHVQAFLDSMKADLQDIQYTNKDQTDAYIYGSADVVGLMCLSVFTEGNQAMFDKLKEPAMRLGSAFQKVNFLRDLKNDTEDLGRSYFPHVTRENFSESSKAIIIREIEDDFNQAFQGIKQLPHSSRTAVFLAYLYYKRLLKKLKRTPAEKIANQRIRISNFTKLMLMNRAVLANRLSLF
jgi:phytoene synthase